MKKCTICGRETNRTYNLYGYKTVCSKHMHQIMKYGHPIDSISRTNSDLNDYKTNGITAIFNLYNQKNEKISEFIIDFEDLERVKYLKWRLSHGHVVTGLPAKGTQRDLSHVVLEMPLEQVKNKKLVIDHINGNPLDNRKNNLRICPQGKNAINKSFMSNNTSGFIGISYNNKKNRYDPEIRINNQRCHLGYTLTLEEAVYKRYIAEKLLFKEFANIEEHFRKKKFCECLLEEKKQELEKIVISKLTSKNLLSRQ